MPQANAQKLESAASDLLSAVTALILAYGHLWSGTEEGEALAEAMNEVSEILDEA